MTGNSPDMQSVLRMHCGGVIRAGTLHLTVDYQYTHTVYLLLRLILNYGKEALYNISEGEGTTVHQRANRHSPEGIVSQRPFRPGIPL